MSVDNKQYAGGWKSPRLRSSRAFGATSNPPERPTHPIFDGVPTPKSQHHLVGPIEVRLGDGVVSLGDGESAWFVMTDKGVRYRVCYDCGDWGRAGTKCQEHEVGLETEEVLDQVGSAV